MKAALPLARRAAVALTALVISAAIFRPPVADALVARGDDAARSGDTAYAVALFRRALLIDARNDTAADRLAFSLLCSHRGADDRSALDVATAGLAVHPANVALLADRALAETRLHLRAQAERDFAAAGHAGRDARYEHFAGTVALARGRRAAATSYFRAALAYDAHFAPARAALARLGSP